MKQALIVIDMQNGFLNPESPLCIRGARATVPACARVITACRRANVPVIFVNRAYRADGSDVEHTRYHVWAEGGRPLTPGSTGPLSVENPPEFGRRPEDYEIVKPRYSAFFQTSLDLLLRRLGVDTVLLTGTTTPNCIRTTCYDAVSLDYQVVVLADCCSSNTEEIQQANLLDMGNIGAKIRSSSDFLTGLEDGLLSIRPATMADLDRCAEIEAACFPREQAASRASIRDGLLSIRPATMADLDRCAEIEAACFPREQAASRASIRDRLSVYPGHVLLGELDGAVVGYAMGPVIGVPAIADEMFANAACHDPAGRYQSVFSLAVHPDWQRQGCGRQLLNALIDLARLEGRQAVTLTCRQEKIAYYESFGFVNQGTAASVHGGVVWYDMMLRL